MELFLELVHIDLRQLAALKAEGDPILLLLVERKNRLAHQCVGEDATLIESFLQTCMCFTGRLAAAVDCLGDVVDTVGPILCFLQGVLIRVSKHCTPDGADGRHAHRWRLHGCPS